MTDAPARARLEVWGDPIAHSRSPELHGAAYGVLGLDWSYGRRRVGAADFDESLGGLGPEWRGLSLTMPLKEAALRAASQRNRWAELTGGVNTLRLGARGGPSGVNTDVGGLERSLREQGVEQIGTARIVGAGATAASALVALAELGARRIDVMARRPERVASLIAMGEAMGVGVEALRLEDSPQGRVDVTIGTLPGGTVLDAPISSALASHGGLLLDVAYSPWPSDLARAWREAGHTAISGLTMLIHQALLQVRFFVAGDVDAELPDEPAVLAAMRAAVVGD